MWATKTPELFNELRSRTLLIEFDERHVRFSWTGYCHSAFWGFRNGGKVVLCPPRVPQCSAIAERFVRSIKEECLSRMIFLGQEDLRTVTSSFADYYNRLRTSRMKNSSNRIL